MLFQELFTEETSILRHILDQEAKHQNASCKFDEDIEYEIKMSYICNANSNSNRITTLQSLLEFDRPCARQNTAQLVNIPSGTT